jgi:hypothetical protein
MHHLVGAKHVGLHKHTGWWPYFYETGSDLRDGRTDGTLLTNRLGQNKHVGALRWPLKNRLGHNKHVAALRWPLWKPRRSWARLHPKEAPRRFKHLQIVTGSL